VELDRNAVPEQAYLSDLLNANNSDDDFNSDFIGADIDSKTYLNE
jgi:hypothetical protein